MLKIENLSVVLNKTTILDDVSLEVGNGGRLGLIGPNGAGKSTMLNAISGMCRTSSGSINFNNVEISRESMADRNRRGIARTLQHSSLFGNLSCFENVLAALQRGQRWWRSSQSAKKSAHDLLERVGLTTRSTQTANELSHGEKRLLEIAIALGTNPQLLIMDEPLAGLDAEDRLQIRHVIEDLDGISLLFVEHDVDAVFEFADRVGVLHQGRLLVIGLPEEIQSDRRVHEIYLGQSDVVA